MHDSRGRAFRNAKETRRTNAKDMRSDGGRYVKRETRRTCVTAGAGRIVARPHNWRGPQRSAITRIELP